MLVLGIETSCDETGIALFELLGRRGAWRSGLLAQALHSQVQMHAEYGEIFEDQGRTTMKKVVVRVEEPSNRVRSVGFPRATQRAWRRPFRVATGALVLAALAGGCAAGSGNGGDADASLSRPGAARAAEPVIHASTSSPASAPGTMTAAQQALRDIAELPKSPPTRLPPPKIISDGEKSTLIYPCRHAQTTTLQQAIEGLLSPEGSAHASPALNAIVISDRTALIQSLLETLEELDAARDQLLVEARVVEVSANRDLEYEIRHVFKAAPGASTFLQDSAVALGVPGASNPGQGLDLAMRTWDQDGKTLTSFIRLLSSRGRSRILSSPNLIVAPGEEASIITGEEVPVQSSTISGGSTTIATQFKRVGIKLRVQLLQLTNDTARLEINPEVSTVTGFTAVQVSVNGA